MLNENIRAIRKARGLSQQELAVQLNVVRQTLSKWEQGRSVPDADMLIALSQALETPVSTLLGETVSPPAADDMKAVAAKLEVVNLQLARRKRALRWWAQGALAAVCAALLLGFVLLALWGSPYLGWDYGDPETAVIGVGLHVLEWIFVRTAPVLLIAAAAGIFLVRRKKTEE